MSDFAEREALREFTTESEPAMSALLDAIDAVVALRDERAAADPDFGRTNGGYLAGYLVGQAEELGARLRHHYFGRALPVVRSGSLV